LPSRRTLLGRLGLALALSAPLAHAAAPAPPEAVRVEGALPRSGTLGRRDLESLGSTTATWTSHGTTHRVVGVRLDAVLAHFGFTPGPMGKDIPVADKRRGYRQIVVATARDGFQAVFSCAEVTAGMGPTLALIAWEIDGKPVEPEAGPFRLVVTTDGEPSRSIRQLERIQVAEPRP
jgi:DMSO/TMAO reductase YedYZ molybdopterin-dependent catalytic subunit